MPGVLAWAGTAEEDGSTPLSWDPVYYARAGLLPDPVTGDKDGLPRDVSAKELGPRATVPRSACSVTCTPNACLPQSCALAAVEWTPTSATRIMAAPGTYTVDLATSSVNNNDARFTMSNTGTCDIVAPWVVVNGQRDFYSISTILQTSLGGTTVPEQMAFGLWDLVRRHRYNWTPAEAGTEVHSPVKLFCVYGYGLCDDSAQVLTCLWKQAGLPDTRVWNLYNRCRDGHVVSEVQYGGAWHLIDADHEVFYPLPPGNRELASVMQLHGDRSLVTRVSRHELACCEEYGDFMAGLYADTVPTTVTQTWNTASTMRMTLRPGETLSLVNRNMSSVPDGVPKGGKYHDNYQRTQPYMYGNGRMTYSPPLAAMTTTELQTRLGAVNMECSTSPLARLKSGQTSGDLVVRMASPYVFVGGSVTLDAVLGASSSVVVQFSKTGVSYTTLGTISQSGRYSYTLDSRIAPTSSAACYTFYLRLRFSAPTNGPRPGIDWLYIPADVQCALQALPLFYGATANTVQVRFEPPGAGAALAVTHEFATGPLSLPAVPHAPVEPPDAGTTGTLMPLLTWGSETIIPGQECAVWRHVPLAWDAGGIVLLYPDCVARSSYGGDAAWLVASGWLSAGNTYYWRVRELSSLCTYSPMWSFTLTPDAPVNLSSLSFE